METEQILLVSTVAAEAAVAIMVAVAAVVVLLAEAAAVALHTRSQVQSLYLIHKEFSQVTAR